MARATSSAARNPFWAYSLRLYRRPGVAPACLALQERLGVDVNLFLFCLWTASRGVALAPRTLGMAVDISTMWSANVVKPLRGVRRFLKPMQLPVYRGQVARAELAAEKLEQMLLFGLLAQIVPTAIPGGELAVRHLRLYGARAKLRWQSADIGHLGTILAAAFSGAEERHWRRSLTATA